MLVQLDEAYLRDRLLPRLAEAHFGPAATRPLRASRSCAARTGRCSTRASPTRSSGGERTRGRGARAPGPRSRSRPPPDGARARTPCSRGAARPATRRAAAAARGGQPLAARGAPSRRLVRGGRRVGRAAQPGDGLRRAGAARRHGARARGLGAARAAAGAPAARVRHRRHARAQHAARRDPLGGPEPGGRDRDRPGPGAPLRRPDREGGRAAHARSSPRCSTSRGSSRRTAPTRWSRSRSRRWWTRCCATTRSCSQQAGLAARARRARATCRECAATRPRCGA